MAVAPPPTPKPRFDSSGILTEILTPPAMGLDTHFRRAFPDSRTDLHVAPPIGLMASPADVPGYEILRELGRGGMGIVFLARQLRLDRLIALKVLLNGRYASFDDQTRFRREVEAVAKLHHTNIVQVYEVGEHDGVLYAAFEFVDGRTLAAALGEKSFEIRDAVSLMIPLARAIQHAHDAGILHRDLKPGNILLAETRNAECGTRNENPSATSNPFPLRSGSNSAFRIPNSAFVAKVTDFGLAKRLDVPEALTATGTACGTPQYMAPEQVLSDKSQIGPGTDVYGLGAILYELLTGQPPFTGDTSTEILRRVVNEEPVSPCRVKPAVPVDLDTIAMKCLEKSAAKRYARAADVADDLERWLDGRGISARPIGRLEHGWRWCRRNPAVTALIATLLLGLASTCTFMVRAWQSAEAESQSKIVAEAARDAAREALSVAAAARESEAKERQRAEDNYQAARNAMQDSIMRLVNDSRLMDFGAADLSRGLLEDYRPFIDRLMTLNPNKAALLNEDAHVLVGLARFAISTGEYDKAEVYLKNAIDRGDRSCAMEPERLSLAFAGAMAKCELGDLYNRLGKPDDARPLMAEAAVVLERLIENHPKNVPYRRNICRIYLAQGNQAIRTGDYSFVEQQCRIALDQTDTLNELLGEQVETLQFRAVALNNLSVAAQKQGRHTESLEQLNASIAVREKLAGLPGISQRYRYQADLALAVDNLGQDHTRANRLRDAEVAYRRAVMLSADVLRDAPRVITYQLDRARYLAHHATCIINLGRIDEALTELEQAEALVKPIYEKNPKLLTARDGTRLVHRGRAAAYERLNRHADAAKEWAAAVPLALNDVMKLRFMAWQAASLARNGDDDAARKLVQEIAAAPIENTDLWFDLALVHGALANAAPPDAASVAADVASARAWLKKIDDRHGEGTFAKGSLYRKSPDLAKVRE